ncbi:thiopurine S-methyltransferase [Dechloromonas sp. H13]|uniref:thiopurine S-methyltransferase n=1 Tax=Dechloromonas sp. H13 TaxID=2570193 RepID=UPI001291D93E|nr:thiopurine S-methyltransferase [Dechloromonas sp. H13]
MDASFWHAKWEKSEIGFHQDDFNPLLLEHFGALSLPAGSRVFVPLCGKTRDILWLLESGYRVVGVELSRVAVDQLFADMELQPAISRTGPLPHFAVEDLDIYCGDIFDLTGSELGRIDAVYDRAALVALPATMRQRYADHLAAVTGRARQLLVAYEYDQSLQDGPPFAVGADEIRRLYSPHYEPTLLASTEVAGGLRGKCPATEHVWLLRRD